MSHSFESLRTLTVLRLLFGITFCLLAAMETALAQTAEQAYQSGHQPLEVWDNAARQSMPQWVQIWLAIMMSTFALGLLFVWRHVEARWVVGGFIAMLLVTVATGRVFGLVPLSGLFMNCAMRSVDAASSATVKRSCFASAALL